MLPIVLGFISTWHWRWQSGRGRSAKRRRRKRRCDQTGKISFDQFLFFYLFGVEITLCSQNSTIYLCSVSSFRSLFWTASIKCFIINYSKWFFSGETSRRDISVAASARRASAQHQQLRQPGASPEVPGQLVQGRSRHQGQRNGHRIVFHVFVKNNTILHFFRNFVYLKEESNKVISVFCGVCPF